MTRKKSLTKIWIQNIEDFSLETPNDLYQEVYFNSKINKSSIFLKIHFQFMLLILLTYKIKHKKTKIKL